jgi:hypothetical protein
MINKFGGKCRSAIPPIDSQMEAYILKYMLLTYLDERAWANLGEEEQQRQMARCEPHLKKLIADRKLLDGAPLEPTSVTTQIHRRDGKRVVIDGPFAETREQLGGYSLVDAKDLDEAIEIAWGFIQFSDMCTIEIRPVVDHPPVKQL